MKAILFDSSTLISLSTSCSLVALEFLKKSYDGEFIITKSVKSETIDKAANTLRFKHEGFRLKRLLEKGVLKIYDESKLYGEVNRIASIANSACFAWGKPVRLIHPGEITLLAMANKLGADAIAIDERATRLLVENPYQMADVLRNKLHTNIKTDNNKIEQLKQEISGINILRSVDLGYAAFKKGFFGAQNKDILEGFLWALRFAGCAISTDELKDYINIF